MSEHFATEPAGAPFAWFSAKADDCITHAKKVSRAKVQPWEAEHYDQPLYTSEAQPADSAYSLDYAMQIAGLWRNGKLIGGDPYAVCASLLAEVDRQRLGREKDQS